MPGMQSGLNIGNPLVAAAFRAALRQQLFIAAAIFLLLWLARLIAASRWPPGLGDRDTPALPEPAGRKVLRIGFAILWIFDGLLQAQPNMPLGLTTQVIEPTATSSPSWVQHLVNWAGTSWTYHPIEISAAAVWIQVGIGLWLLFARQGRWARAGALASVGWGLVVWAFGESFGGVFAPGLTWLFGAPGAVLIYCVAGALLALPERLWHTRRLGRLMLAGTGVFFAGMAVLQAWPGRGFWQGRVGGQPGTLTSMIQTMSQTPQPHYLARIVSDFAAFVAAHGFGVNLFVVIALAVLGLAFLSGQPRITRLATGAGVVLCLADWVLIEDLGFLGGLGTDPNSMLPMILVLVSGYLIMTQAPQAQAVQQAVGAAGTQAAGAQAAGAQAAGAQAAEPQTAEPQTAEPVAAIVGPARPAEPARPAAEPVPPPSPSRRLRPRALLEAGGRALATASGRSIAAAGALGVTLLGAVPSLAARANPNADSIIAQAIGGTASTVTYRAAPFSLIDQRGAAVSLASLRGKVVLLTFFDPVCTSDCPLIGHEFADAARLLAGQSSRIELAAIVLNPTYRSLPVLQAFDRQEGLSRVPDWLYLTGTLPQLRKVWHDYGMVAQNLPAGAMTLHNDVAYVIDGSGRIRQVLSTDPGPGTAASRSSFAVELANAARRVLATS